MSNLISHDYYMRLALAEAKRALEEDEIPIGAIAVSENQIVGKGYNMVEKLNDSTAHAEMIALSAAMQHFNNKYLSSCFFYVTVEPCLMCASALSWAQVKGLIFGAHDEKKGFSNYHPSPFHSKIEITGGVWEAECAKLLKSFFSSKRKKF